MIPLVSDVRGLVHVTVTVLEVGAFTASEITVPEGATIRNEKRITPIEKRRKVGAMFNNYSYHPVTSEHRWGCCTDH